MRDDPFEAMSTHELDRMRADLNVSAALAAPGSPGHVTVKRELHRIAFALSARERESPPPARLFPRRGTVPRPDGSC